jgi:hypothetical protein
VVQGVKLSKTEISTTAEEIERMKGHPLCLGHRFYKVCHAVCLAMCLAKRYQRDLGVDHWTAVKIILKDD